MISPWWEKNAKPWLKTKLSDAKQIFNLLGGGIRIGGEYVPVELERVDAAINSMKEV